MMIMMRMILMIFMIMMMKIEGKPQQTSCCSTNKPCEGPQSTVSGLMMVMMMVMVVMVMMVIIYVDNVLNFS